MFLVWSFHPKSRGAELVFCSAVVPLVDKHADSARRLLGQLSVVAAHRLTRSLSDASLRLMAHALASPAPDAAHVSVAAQAPDFEPGASRDAVRDTRLGGVASMARDRPIAQQTPEARKFQPSSLGDYDLDRDGFELIDSHS